MSQPAATTRTASLPIPAHSASSAPPHLRDRDALAYCFSLMPTDTRIACAATCRTWREATYQPAAWRYWTKRLQIFPLACLSAIPDRFRPLLRRLAFHRHVLECASAEERTWLKELTGVEEVEVFGAAALVIFLDAHPPSVGGGAGRPLMRLRVNQARDTDDVWPLLTTHPRLAQLTHLELPDDKPTTSQLESTRSHLPNLEAIELRMIEPEAAPAFADFLRQRPQLKSLTLGSLDPQTQAAVGPLPPSITSLTVKYLQMSDASTGNVLSMATHLRQLDLVIYELDSSRVAPLFVALARLRHLDRVHLRYATAAGFRVEDALPLVTHNKSQLEWRALGCDDEKLRWIEMRRRKEPPEANESNSSSSIPSSTSAGEDLRTASLTHFPEYPHASWIDTFDALVGCQAECLRLSCYRPDAYDDMWTTIGRQTRLQVLEISASVALPMTDAVDQLRQCQRLRVIKLDNTVCRLTVDLMRIMSRLPRLEQLELTDLRGHMLPSTTVDVLARLPALQRFSLQTRLDDMPQREPVDLALLRRLVRRVGPRLTVTYNGRVVTDEPRAKAKRGCDVQ